MEYKEDSGSSFIWFLAGFTLGSVVACLYAPLSGRQTRRYISDTAEDARDYVTKHGRKVYKRGRDVLDDASDMVERGSRAVSEFIGSRH